MRSPLWAVLPGGIDDPAAPSGGNRFDREVLSRVDRDVHEFALPGAWPVAAPAARDALAGALAGVPDGADVLLDGLVACGVPEVLEPHAARLRLHVLVHLPLSDETGLSDEDAAYLRGLERRTVHVATTVIATSRAAAARIAEMHDLPVVRVVEPGVSAAPLTIPSDEGNRLVNVAAVTPRKGQDLLVSVLERDLADLRWECTFAGALVRPVPHTHPAIRFLGPRTGKDLDAVYAGADLFVLPSRAETYGMVVTEALARGIPVLATAVGGVAEALGAAPDGTRPGLLVPPDDPPALAGALRAWLTDPELRGRRRTAAAARRETLPTWTEAARRLDDALGRDV